MVKFIIFFLLILISTLTINGQNKSINQKNDSISNVLKSKLEKSEELTSIANYPKAYDTVWNVLITADSIQDSNIKYQAYQRLSVLYSIFNKKEEAISAIDSVFHYVKHLEDYQDLKIRSSIFYSAALTYRMNNKYAKANKFLDISEQLLDSLKVSIPNKIYIYTERAHLHTLTGNLIDAEQHLKKISQQITPKH
jgi:tetratricopeptide (TPR) repeat protein